MRLDAFAHTTTRFCRLVPRFTDLHTLVWLRVTHTTLDGSPRCYGYAHFASSYGSRARTTAGVWTVVPRSWLHYARFLCTLRYALPRAVTRLPRGLHPPLRCRTHILIYRTPVCHFVILLRCPGLSYVWITFAFTTHLRLRLQFVARWSVWPIWITRCWI